MQWDYVERGGTYGAGYQRANYRGLVIEAHIDADASNPWEAWDCEPPTVVYSGGRHGSLSDYSQGVALNPLRAISDGRFKRHWRAIAEACELKPDSLHAEAKESQRDYGGGLTDIKRELCEAALEELKPGYYGGNAGDYFRALAALWAIAGREAVAWTSCGYSQGDYADGLSVATAEWQEKTGAPRKTHKRQLEAAGELWGAWAWGDVYGFIIKAPGGADLDGLGFVGDSVWGYYGSDHGESGLEESAMQSADHLLDSVRKKRGETLKRLVRNRVPLELREELLAAVTGPLEPLFSGKESDNDD